MHIIVVDNRAFIRKIRLNAFKSNEGLFHKKRAEVTSSYDRSQKPHQIFWS